MHFPIQPSSFVFGVTYSISDIRVELLFKTKRPRRKKMTSIGSLNKPPSFKGEWYALLKDKMRIFIEWVNFEMWKAVKLVHSLPHMKSMMLW